jgi:hypothetical protein
MISMSTSQRKKRSIQRQEHISIVAFQLLIVLAFLITASLGITFTHMSGQFGALSNCLIPLVLFGPLLLAGILGIMIMLPFGQRIQRQKQNWFNEYGLYTLALVAQYPEQDALIVGGLSRSYNASYTQYLNWQDPQTGQRYAFCVSRRSHSALRKLSKGDLYPVQFDPHDSSFFSFPLPQKAKYFKKGG